MKTHYDGFSMSPCPGGLAKWYCVLALLSGWLVLCFGAVYVSATLFAKGGESFGKRLVTSVIATLVSGLGSGQLFGIPPLAWLGSAIGYLLGLLSLPCTGDRLRLPRVLTLVWLLLTVSVPWVNRWSSSATWGCLHALRDAPESVPRFLQFTVLAIVHLLVFGAGLLLLIPLPQIVLLSHRPRVGTERSRKRGMSPNCSRCGPPVGPDEERG